MTMKLMVSVLWVIYLLQFYKCLGPHLFWHVDFRKADSKGGRFVVANNTIFLTPFQKKEVTVFIFMSIHIAHFIYEVNVI